jgi:hypothetical protein
METTMQLVKTRVDHTFSIVTDDGIQLGVIYFGTQPVDDEGRLPAEVFHKWWEKNVKLRESKDDT